MFITLLSHAFRSIRKNSIFSVINIAGLCLGITSFILIMEFVAFERSYNSFHENIPNLYRVLTTSRDGSASSYTAPGFAPLAGGVVKGIDQYCRIAEGANLGTGIVTRTAASNTQDQAFRENNFIYADGNFFGFFSFPILQGNPASLLKPNVVALSRKTSERYFGKESPIGKILTLNNQFGKTLYNVEIVYEDMPSNSDLRYDLVFSLQTLSNNANLNGNDSWASLTGIGSQWLFTYVSLKGNSPEEVSGEYTAMMKRSSSEDPGECILQPVSMMHLGSSINDPLPSYGSLKFVYLLIGISFLILCIGWFNFVNLATAGALRRAKEVGVRKVVGASRQQLIWQFLGESLIVNFVALVFSLAAVGVLQTPYKALIEKQVSIDSLINGDVFVLAVLLFLAGVVSSGFYAAFILSSFNASVVLKGAFSKSKSGSLVRKSLIVFQFSISVMLIATTIVLFQQWKFMENKDLGIKTNQLVIVRGPEVNKDDTFAGRGKEFESSIGSLSFVQSVSTSGNVPSDGFNFSTSGITRANPYPGSEEVNYDILTIDENYLDTYQINLAAGLGFTHEMCDKSWNEMKYVILNEIAAEKMGFASAEEAVDAVITWGERQFIVRGVVKDYHHQSVQYAIGPIIFLPSTGGGYYSLKLNTSDIRANLKEIELLFKRSFPGNPFEYKFLDDAFASAYFAEQQYSTIFSAASALAILIACMGLFGLAMYSVEQRAKEIGIRKVLGSSVVQIVSLFTGDFLKLVLVGFITAIPLSWYFIQQWLSGFAYHVEIQWWIFIYAGIGIGMIAFITVSVEVIRGARSNPIDKLRSE